MIALKSDPSISEMLVVSINIYVLWVTQKKIGEVLKKGGGGGGG